MRISNLRRVFFVAVIINVAVWIGLCLGPGAAAENTNTLSRPDLLSPVLQGRTADAAYAELDNANRNPPPDPAGWSVAPPTALERQKFVLPYLQALTDKAKDFYTRFPKDARASKAKLMEFQLLSLAMQWGETNQLPRFEASEKSVLNDPALAGETHFQILWAIALISVPDQARPLFQEIARNAPTDKFKTAAAQELKKLDALGKPVELQFTAVDGRSVDLAKLKGKVVMIDFWATWCEPCVAGMPDVKKTYDQFHAKGFEIVGISLDKEKDKLTQFVAEHKMEWPQFFDGMNFQNKYARQFGIQTIPAMWLIDKKGLLRIVDARVDLSGEVQKLLAE